MRAASGDHHWERRIGAYWSGAKDGLELDRARIEGRLNGRWFVAVAIIDGEGNAPGMMGKRVFGGAIGAQKASRMRAGRHRPSGGASRSFLCARNRWAKTYDEASRDSE